MLQPNFESGEQKKSLNRTKSHQPKLRVEYSAGFRKLESNKKQDDRTQKTSLSNYNSHQSEILKYVDQIGIQNLTHLYSETIQDPTKLLLQKCKQQQLQSVVRLYKNLYPTSRSRVQQQVIQQEDKDKKYASELWNLDKKFEKEPPQYIVRKQLQKMYKKYQVELNGMIKRKKIQGSFPFKDIFTCFLLEDSENIIKITSKSLVNGNYQRQIFYLWKRFLSTLNFKLAFKKYQTKTIMNQKVLKLKNLSKFLYCIIKCPLSNHEEGQKVQIKSLKFDQLRNWVLQELSIPIQQIKSKFEIEKHYTNPYCIEYKNKKVSDDHSQFQSQDQIASQFKAIPVPKTTYKLPKQAKLPEPKTTVLQPFKLTEQKKQKIPYEQYYHWERQFKAQPIPDTNKKPFKPELLSEQQKKARAFMNLQKAKYPKTMQNLNNYPKEYQEKIQELTKNHVKSKYQGNHHHQIPNFDHLHAQEIVKFQNIKERNKKEIKVQPFHLSTGKQRIKVQYNNYTGSPRIHPYSPPKAPAKPSKSTKKFDAYVHYRSDYEAKRAQKHQKEAKQNERENQNKKPYRQIIKSRMIEQLQSHPIKKNAYDGSFPPKIKVDKQKIYRQKPLLMQSTLPPEQPHLSWDPIF